MYEGLLVVAEGVPGVLSWCLAVAQTAQRHADVMLIRGLGARPLALPLVGETARCRLQESCFGRSAETSEQGGFEYERSKTRISIQGNLVGGSKYDRYKKPQDMADDLLGYARGGDSVSGAADG